MSRRAYFSIGFGVIVVVAGMIFAGTNKVGPVSWSLWGPINEDAGLALKGYDPVLYQTEGTAQPGSADVSLEWSGVEWHFTTAENRLLFEAAPETYAPQYGGFCATAVAKGLTADIDAQVWNVTAGRLYTFNNQDAKESWIAELGEGVIARGDENWGMR